MEKKFGTEMTFSRIKNYFRRRLMKSNTEDDLEKIELEASKIN